MAGLAKSWTEFDLYQSCNLTATQRLLVPTAGLLLLGSLIALGPHIDLARGGGDYVLGSFWKTWGLAVAVTVTGPISYAPYLGDWTRYVSHRRWSDRRILTASAGGLVVAMLVPGVIGAATTTAFTDVYAPYVEGLVAASPTWYLIPIIFVGITATVGQGAIGLYGTGLDLEAIIPNLHRSTATAINSVAGFGLIFLGTFAFDAQDSITAFVLLLTTITTPWMAIILAGFVHRRGRYVADDLQVFNRGQRGGGYWYTQGWNIGAVMAWLAGSAVGLAFTSSTLLTGPWANLAGGIDLSFTSAALVAGAIYAVVLRLQLSPGTASDEVPPHTRLDQA